MAFLLKTATPVGELCSGNPFFSAKGRSGEVALLEALE
jgi:hypothetical protein